MGGGFGFLLAVIIIPLIFSLIVLAFRKSFPREAFTIMTYGMLVVLTPLIYKGLKAERAQVGELISIPATYTEFRKQHGLKAQSLKFDSSMHRLNFTAEDNQGVNIEVKEYKVGGATIEIPIPVLFYEVSDTSSMAFKISKASTPPLNRIIALFVSEADLTSERPGLERFMRIQVPRKFENRNFTPVDFAKIVKRIKEQEMIMFEEAKIKHEPLLSMLSDSISEVVDLNAKIGLDSAIPLGVFDETPYSLSFATLATFNYDIDGIVGDYRMIVGTSVTLVNGKLVFLYTSSKFRNKNDLDWVKIRQRIWINSIVRK
jgi:hypothetical protein